MEPRPPAMDGPAHLRFPRPLLAALAALLATVATAATLAPAARADAGPAARWPTGGAALTTAMGLAADHWGMAPCSGRVTMAWTELDTSMNAESSWSNPVDPYLQPSRDTNCEIDLSTRADWDWPKLCTVVIHEVGHLTGHQHVDDPADVMYYAYVAPVPECAATPEPVQPAVPATAAPAAPAAAPSRAAATAKAAAPRSAVKAPARRHAATRRRAATRHGRSHGRRAGRRHR